MRERARHLAHKRESLRLRAAAQRADLAYTVGAIEQRLNRIDGTLNTVRRLGTKPLAIGVGAALLALIGPRRLFGWVTRSAVLAGTARQLIKQFRS